jgi:hypothetical protein
MEHTLIHLAETAAWLFFIVFVFAVIGVIATIRWIVAMVTRGEQAVETGVRDVGEHLHHHDSEG